APGPHPPPRRFLCRARARVRAEPRAPARLRRGRVRAPSRPRPRHLPQGLHLGRGAREARGAGALRGPRRLQDGGAGAVSVTPSAGVTALAVGLRLALLALLAVPAGGRADDLLAEA